MTNSELLSATAGLSLRDSVMFLVRRGSMDTNAATEKKDDGKGRVKISLDQVSDFEFRVRIGEGVEDFILDEPPPVGKGAGPSPSQLLATAVGGCLSASFLFCARKLRMDLEGIHTDISVSHVRNEKGRLRIGKIDVDIQPRIASPDDDKMQRCLDLYEDFCVVTQSVRNGIDISVNVRR